MSKKQGAPYLGEFELLVLLAVLRLEGHAYGVTIHAELERETSRRTTFGSVYKTLGRLEAKGYLGVRFAEPTAERGGRRKKLYHLKALGVRAVRQSFADLRRLTRGLGGELEAL